MNCGRTDNNLYGSSPAPQEVHILVSIAALPKTQWVVCGCCASDSKLLRFRLVMKSRSLCSTWQNCLQNGLLAGIMDDQADLTTAEGIGRQAV